MRPRPRDGRDGFALNQRRRQPARRRRSGAVGAVAARAVDRILVGWGPTVRRREFASARARSRHLPVSSGAGGHVVEARLLTHAATSRQTLSLVMDEIGLRFGKGIVLSTTASRDTGGRAARRRRRNRRRGGAGGGGTRAVRPVNARRSTWRPVRASALVRRAPRARRCRVRDVAGGVVGRVAAAWMATVAFNGFDTGDGQQIGGVALAVSFGAARGRVCIEAAFASRLVDAVLRERPGSRRCG